MTDFRYNQENIIFLLSISALFVILILTAGLSLCLLPLFLIVILILAYTMNRSARNAYLEKGRNVEEFPAMNSLTNHCREGLNTGDVDVIIIPERSVNAFTFGFSNPKVIILHSSLVKIMDKDELRFTIGHEMGHIVLGHTWLNTLLSSLSGMSSSFGAYAILNIIFLWWKRACEYSADRAGLLACGSLNKAVTTLIKLTDPDADTAIEFQQALEVIEQEDDSFLNVLGETLSTHPMTINRIEQLRKYAASRSYERHQASFNHRLKQTA